MTQIEQLFREPHDRLPEQYLKVGLSPLVDSLLSGPSWVRHPRATFQCSPFLGATVDTVAIYTANLGDPSSGCSGDRRSAHVVVGAVVSRAGARASEVAVRLVFAEPPATANFLPDAASAVAGRVPTVRDSGAQAGESTPLGVSRRPKIVMGAPLACDIEQPVIEVCARQVASAEGVGLTSLLQRPRALPVVCILACPSPLPLLISSIAFARTWPGYGIPQYPGIVYPSVVFHLVCLPDQRLVTACPHPIGLLCFSSRGIAAVRTFSEVVIVRWDYALSTPAQQLRHLRPVERFECPSRPQARAQGRDSGTGGW